jgi:toxin ParE1/3/4
MAHRVAPQAEAELDNIWYYVAKESGSVEIADRLIDSITERYYLLACHPHIGRHRDEDLRPGLRSFPVGEYVIVYRVEEKERADTPCVSGQPGHRGAVAAATTTVTNLMPGGHQEFLDGPQTSDHFRAVFAPVRGGGASTCGKRARGSWIRYSCLFCSKLLQRICAIRCSGQYVSGCEIMELPRMGG